jgi:hypothetical protein
VWNGVGPGINHCHVGYNGTCFHNILPPDQNFGLLGFRMRHTACGSLLIATTVVVADGLLVYENLMKGENYSYITHLSLGS